MPAERFKIQLPLEARKGEPVRAEDFNRLRSACKTMQEMLIARTPQPSPDIGFRFEPGGFVAFLKKRGGGGGGGGGGIKAAPLTLTSSRPRYIAAPDDPVPAGKKRFYMRFGTINGVMASNYDRTIDLSDTVANYVWAHVTFAGSVALSVSSWQLVIGTTENEHVTDTWGSDGQRPDEGWWLLSRSIVIDEVLIPLDIGGGSIEISEHVINLKEGPDGAAMIDKALLWTRQTY